MSSRPNTLAEIPSVMDEGNQLLARKVQLILQTGKLLMENSADTDRIVRSMNRAGRYLGIPADAMNIHITFTTIMVSIGIGNYHITKMLKCPVHKVDMTIISRMSKLLWRAIEENYPIDKFEEELAHIEYHKRKYSQFILTLGAGFACGGFAKLFGADLMACLFTAIASSFGFYVRHKCIKMNINMYMAIAISSFVAVVGAYFTHFIPVSATPWHPVLACTLFIVPGVPLINSIEDLLDNYIVSGTTRGINSLLMVGSMTFGIVFAIKIFHVVDFTTLPVHVGDYHIVTIMAAFISAAGFSTLFNVPPRLLWVVGLGGVMSVMIRNLSLTYIGAGLPEATLLGAIAVSIISIRAVHWFHVPSHVITIPSVIPMIPGLFIYRLLFNIIDIGDLQLDKFVIAFQGGITATLVILAIAIGVAIPDIFAKKYIDAANATRLAKALERRKALQNQSGAIS